MNQNQNQNQNQCVPRCRGVEDDVTLDPSPRVRVVPPPPPSTVVAPAAQPPYISLQDYEMAELTWENGHLTMHGLGPPRVPNKSNLASGTLESVVHQATKDPPPPVNDDNLVPLFDRPPNSVPTTVDALVPTANNVRTTVGSSTRVGSCSVAAARVPSVSDWSVSLSGSGRRRGDTLQQMSGGMTGMTSTSFGLSLDYTKTVVTGGDDHDSVCHSRPQDEEEENEKKGSCKSLGKRCRAAAVHNQSERKRRDKINQRMKTLQKMVPNSNKTDKSSMLDGVIDYLKQLQAQVQMMSRMSMPSMMMTMPPMPMHIQQQLQMSHMGMPVGMGMGMMGMGMPPGMAPMPGIGLPGIDPMNNIKAAAATATRSDSVTGVSNAIAFPPAFMPGVTWDGASGAPSVGERVLSYEPTMVPSSDPLSTYLACQQSQPMTIDAYNRMTAMYQQLLQQQQLGHNSKFK